MWLLQTNEQLSRLSFGWKCGCQPFSCRCTQNVTHCRMEFCSTCLFKESIPAIPSGNSKHPLLTRSFRFPRAAVRSTSSAFWLHHAHPFIAAAEKNLSHAEKQSGHGVVVSKICYIKYSDCVQDLDYRILIVLSLVTCDCCKPMNNCRDWAFSHRGLEVGLPAFQLPTFAKWEALPKIDFFDMFV